MYQPTIEKGLYYGLLGASGIGKSKFTRYTYIYEPLKFSQETGYPIKILYLALEDSKEYLYKNILVHYLYEKFNIKLPLYVLESQTSPLPDQYLLYLEQMSDFYTKVFEPNVIILDNAFTPDNIKTAVLRFHERYGADNHCIVIIDNYSNVIGATTESDWDAIKYLSRNIIRQVFCKKGITTVSVLQLDQETEKFVYRNANKLSASNLEPNAGSIADAKIVIKDMHSVHALFSPFKYGIEHYPHRDGYDITILRNRFRSLLHIKYNLGEAAPRMGLYVDGLAETFSQMPVLDEKEKLDSLYEQIRKEEEEKRIQRRNFTQQSIF